MKREHVEIMVEYLCCRNPDQLSPLHTSLSYLKLMIICNKQGIKPECLDKVGSKETREIIEGCTKAKIDERYYEGLFSGLHLCLRSYRLIVNSEVLIFNDSFDRQVA